MAVVRASLLLLAGWLAANVFNLVQLYRDLHEERDLQVTVNDARCEQDALVAELLLENKGSRAEVIYDVYLTLVQNSPLPQRGAPIDMPTDGLDRDERFERIVLGKGGITTITYRAPFDIQRVLQRLGPSVHYGIGIRFLGEENSQIDRTAVLGHLQLEPGLVRGCQYLGARLDLFKDETFMFEEHAMCCDEVLTENQRFVPATKATVRLKGGTQKVLPWAKAPEKPPTYTGCQLDATTEGTLNSHLVQIDPITGQDIGP